MSWRSVREPRPAVVPSSVARPSTLLTMFSATNGRAEGGAGQSTSV